VTLFLEVLKAHACISGCGQYRYALWRRWAPGPQVLFVMLKPLHRRSGSGRSNHSPMHRFCRELGLRVPGGGKPVCVSHGFAQDSDASGAPGRPCQRPLAAAAGGRIEPGHRGLGQLGRVSLGATSKCARLWRRFMRSR